MSKVDWKATLATVAPALATALGGPLAGLATQALSTALLGGKADGTEAEIAAALATGGTDALLKIKQAEQQFAVDMRKLDIDLEKVQQADRADARSLAKVDMAPQIGLSVVFIAGYFASLYSLKTLLFADSDINPAILNLASLLIGVFTRELSGIMQFWFGSSSGSKASGKELAARVPGSK